MGRSWTSTKLPVTRRRRSPSSSTCTIPGMWSGPRCRVSPSSRRAPTSYSGTHAAMQSMFAYVCLGSNDLRRSAKFYDAALGVLGYSRCDTSNEDASSWNGWVGWGLYERDGAVQDALWVCKPFDAAPATVG